MWYSKDFVLRKILEKCPDRRDEYYYEVDISDSEEEE